MVLSDRHFPVLVTGAGGLLGRALGGRLARMARSPADLRLTDVADLDVTDGPAVAEAVAALRPRTIFHLAAWTNVDGAESSAETCWRINVEGTENVARAAASAGALMVHISTDFVFGGSRPGECSEDDPISPQGVYARSKAESESRVRAVVPHEHLVVRTAWLYGAGGRNFVDAILSAARQGRPLKVVADQVGCPTWSEDLASALLALVEVGARGTFHACGSGEASRFDLAVEAVRAAGFDVPVEPVTTLQMPRPAPRPARAVLATGKLLRATGFRFPPWQQSVRAYVASQKTREMK